MALTLEFFDIYVTILGDIYFFLAGVLFAYWLYPFVRIKRSAYAAAFFYWLLATAGRDVKALDGLESLVFILSVLIPVLSLYGLDERRNPLQKIFLVIIFLVLRWLPAELMSELAFFERDFVFSFDFFRSSVNVAIAEFVIWNLIFYGSGVALLFWSIRLIHRTYTRKQEELTWRELVMLLAPTCSLGVVRWIILSYFRLWMQGMENGSIEQNIPGSVYNIAFCILSYIAIMVIVIFYQQIKDKQDEIHAGRMLSDQLNEAHRHTEQIESMYEQMRAIRHDVGNHIAVIEGLVESGESDKASEYISAWKERLADASARIKSGNAVTDVALSEFAEHFERVGAHFECGFRYPAGLSIGEFDLCVILTNALQNAYEAVIRMTDHENTADHYSPYVSVASVVRDHTFVVNIRNSIGERRTTDPGTGIPLSDKGGEGHGYGLKNIRTIARKYNGDIEIRQEYDDNGGLVFILNVMLIG